MLEEAKRNVEYGALFRVHHGNGTLIICFVTGAVSLRPVLQWQFSKTSDNSFVKDITSEQVGDGRVAEMSDMQYVQNHLRVTSLD